MSSDVEHLLVEHGDEHVEADGREGGGQQVAANARVSQDVAGAGHGGSVLVGRDRIAIR